MKKLNLLEWFMILAITIFTIYFTLIDTENTKLYLIVDAITAITGVICVVLCAKGKKVQYAFGFINITGYIVIALINKYYGEVMLNALYYLPSQFIGYYLWNKNQNKETNNVKGKKLNLKQTIIFVLLSFVLVFIYNFILNLLGGQNTLLDSISTIFSIFANMLMLLRYREQWILWIIIDIVTVIMWILAKDAIMITMWSIYLINAFYGYFVWTRLGDESV